MAEPAVHGQPDPGSPRFSRGLYYGLVILTWLALRLLLILRIRRHPGLRRQISRGPLIVVGNHASMLDPYLLTAAVFPRIVCFVASDSHFRSPILRWILTRVGTIPISQTHADPHALVRMVRVLKSGGALAIYPEGRRSTDGGSQPLTDSLARLVKKIRCPVVLVHSDGAYLAAPAFCDPRFRPGRVEVRANLLMTPADIVTRSISEIQASLGAALAGNDYAWQQRQRHRHHYWTWTPARGLDLLCHQCPVCRSPLAMRATRRQLVCSVCSHTVTVDRTGLLHHADSAAVDLPPDPHAWHQWQLRELARQLRQGWAGPSVRARLAICVREPDFRPVGAGQVSLGPASLAYTGTIDGQTVRLCLPPPAATEFNVVLGRYFEYFAEGRTYQFTPDDCRAVIWFDDTVAVLEMAEPVFS